MRDNDGRKIDHKSLEILRLRAVEQMVAGTRPEEIAAALGLARATVYGWLASYRDGGRQALLSRPIPGRPPTLTPEQMTRLWTLILDTSPFDQRLGSALWAGGQIRELIRAEFGISLSAVTIRRLLVKMGIPKRRALLTAGQRDLALEHWHRTQYPAIQARAAADEAAVHIADQVSFQPGALAGSEAGPAGPVTVICASTARTGPVFAAYDVAASAMAFTDFCARLLIDVPGMIYLVVDSRPEYRGLSDRDLAIFSGGRLALFFLPEHTRERVPGLHSGRPMTPGPLRLYGVKRPA